MSKREFKATEGLLNDVMRKQAGTVEKAILEAIMNSVDADASHIALLIEPHRIVIEDDGKGMPTEEVEEYFEKFGLKDSDIEDKSFGKFRMGRGQIFNFGKNIWHSLNNVMVVDLDHDTSTVSLDGETHELDTSGLSYNLLNSTASFDGCRVEVQLYNDLKSVSETRGEVEKLIKYIPWLHDVEITINGSEYARNPVPDEETDLAFYEFGREGYKDDVLVYNQGAFVNTYSLDETGGIIITKEDLDVNFARNDILDTCDVWREIREEWNELMKDHLISDKDLTERERIWLLGQAEGDDVFLQRISEKPLVTDVTGSNWSFQNLKEEKVTFASEGSSSAEKMMQQTSIVAIKRQFHEVIRAIMDASNIVRFEDAIDDSMMLDMKEYKDSELSKKRRQNLARARYLLDHVGYEGAVKAGFSDERDTWKNDKGDVVIHKDVLADKKDKFITQWMISIVEAAAHDGSMREEVEHGFTFRRDFWRYMKNAGDYQFMLLTGSADIEPYAEI